MSADERRQFYRIDDHLYFAYRVLESGELCSDLSITNELLGESGQKFMETSQHFQNLDYELSELIQSISVKEPYLANYLKLLNTKIDYLSKQMLMVGTVGMHKVNLSLGGVAFDSNELIKEKANIKVVIYTKPKMIPVIADGVVSYCKCHSESQYRVSVAFNKLSHEQEALLSQHILLAQVKSRAN